MIETTGLADPAPVAQTFFVDDQVAENYRLDAIETVVDSKHAEIQLDRGHEAQEQVAFSDVLLVNKVDLVSEEELLKLEKRLEAGYEVTGYVIVADDYALIQQAIHETCDNPQVEAILLNGGTGITKRDTTYEAVRDLLDKKIHGFGEIFRYLSFAEDIGTAAILSRAVAGVCSNKEIFSMPGSSGAVKLALGRIIILELRHGKHIEKNEGSFHCYP